MLELLLLPDEALLVLDLDRTLLLELLLSDLTLLGLLALMELLPNWPLL